MSSQERHKGNHMKLEVEIGEMCLQNKAAKDGQNEKLRERLGVDSPLESLAGYSPWVTKTQT